eukprot:gene6416-12971_t
MQHANILSIAGLRIDGRRNNELRHVKHRIGVSKSADGSAYFEQGLNKVLVIINGPQEPSRRSGDVSTNKGEIKCNMMVASFSGTERKRRRGGDRRSQETESIIKQTLEGVVMLELYPRSEIVITVHILESDGSLICAVLNASCLALMDAGIAMSDMITSCSAGIVLQTVSQDLTQVEQSSGGAYLPIAIKARSEEVLFVQLDSRISVDSLQEVLDMAIDGCRKVRGLLETAIKVHMTEQCAIGSVSSS